MLKTVLIVDDEIGYAEALRDALEYEEIKVLVAFSAEEALLILKHHSVDLATIDIMLPPGRSLEAQAPSSITGVVLCRTIKKLYPRTDLISISVVTDREIIKQIESQGIRFFKKGEVPLRTVLNTITTRLLGRTFDSSNKL